LTIYGADPVPVYGSVTNTTTTTTSTSTTSTTSTSTSSTTTIAGECPCKGDTPPCDGIVDDFELLDYIDEWVDRVVGDFNLLQAIDNWAAGSGGCG